MIKHRSGNRYNRLTLISPIGVSNKWGAKIWSAICDCGKSITAIPNEIKNGHVKSCGCLNIETCHKRFFTHGMRHSDEYRTWCKIKERCFNVKDKNYKNYGGRGITMCSEWENSFEQFYKDMGAKPKGLTIERKNNEGNYEAGNCIWADYFAQAKNRRSSVFVNIIGVKTNVGDAAKILKIHQGSIYRRSKDKNETYQQATNHFTIAHLNRQIRTVENAKKIINACLAA